MNAPAEKQDGGDAAEYNSPRSVTPGPHEVGAPMNPEESFYDTTGEEKQRLESEILSPISVSTTGSGKKRRSLNSSGRKTYDDEDEEDVTPVTPAAVASDASTSFVAPAGEGVVKSDSEGNNGKGDVVKMGTAALNTEESADVAASEAPSPDKVHDLISSLRKHSMGAQDMAASQQDVNASKSVQEESKDLQDGDSVSVGAGTGEQPIEGDIMSPISVSTTGSGKKRRSLNSSGRKTYDDEDEEDVTPVTPAAVASDASTSFVAPAGEGVVKSDSEGNNGKGDVVRNDAAAAEVLNTRMTTSFETVKSTVSPITLTNVDDNTQCSSETYDKSTSLHDTDKVQELISNLRKHSMTGSDFANAASHHDNDNSATCSTLLLEDNGKDEDSNGRNLPVSASTSTADKTGTNDVGMHQENIVSELRSSDYGELIPSSQSVEATSVEKRMSSVIEAEEGISTTESSKSRDMIQDTNTRTMLMNDDSSVARSEATQQSIAPEGGSVSKADISVNDSVAKVDTVKSTETLGQSKKMNLEISTTIPDKTEVDTSKYYDKALKDRGDDDEDDLIMTLMRKEQFVKATTPRGCIAQPYSPLQRRKSKKKQHSVKFGDSLDESSGTPTNNDSPKNESGLIGGSDPHNSNLSPPSSSALGSIDNDSSVNSGNEASTNEHISSHGIQPAVEEEKNENQQLRTPSREIEEEKNLQTPSREVELMETSEEEQLLLKDKQVSSPSATVQGTPSKPISSSSTPVPPASPERTTHCMPTTSITNVFPEVDTTGPMEATALDREVQEIKQLINDSRASSPTPQSSSPARSPTARGRVHVAENAGLKQQRNPSPATRYSSAEERTGPRHRAGARSSAGTASGVSPQSIAPPSAAAPNNKLRSGSPMTTASDRRRGTSADRANVGSRVLASTPDQSIVSSRRRDSSPATTVPRAASPSPSVTRGRRQERPKPSNEVIYKPPFDLWSRPESPARLRSSTPIRAWRSTVGPSSREIPVRASFTNPLRASLQQEQQHSTQPRLRSSSASRAQFLRSSIDLAGTNNSNVSRNPIIDISPIHVDGASSPVPQRRGSSVTRPRTSMVSLPHQHQRDDGSDMHSVVSRSSFGSRNTTTTPMRRDMWNRSVRVAQPAPTPKEPSMDIRRLYRDVAHSARASPQVSVTSSTSPQRMPSVLRSADGFNNWYEKSGL